MPRSPKVPDLDAIYVRLPISPAASRMLRKHIDGFAKLFEMATATNAGAKEIVAACVVTADELERDLATVTAARKSARAQRLSSPKSKKR